MAPRPGIPPHDHQCSALPRRRPAGLDTQRLAQFERLAVEAVAGRIDELGCAGNADGLDADQRQTPAVTDHLDFIDPAHDGPAVGWWWRKGRRIAGIRHQRVGDEIEGPARITQLFAVREPVPVGIEAGECRIPDDLARGGQEVHFDIGPEKIAVPTTCRIDVAVGTFDYVAVRYLVGVVAFDRVHVGEHEQSSEDCSSHHRETPAVRMVWIVADCSMARATYDPRSQKRRRCVPAPGIAQTTRCPSLPTVGRGFPCDRPHSFCAQCVGSLVLISQTAAAAAVIFLTRDPVAVGAGARCGASSTASAGGCPIWRFCLSML